VARSYEDGCAAAHALGLVGERWALLVVRELLLGPKRFTDLRAGLPGISPNVLSQRLDELERVGIVERHRLPPPAGSWVYELTAWGRELEPVIISLGRWGARSPFHAEIRCTAELSVDSLILSFRTMFDARLADGVTARYELRIGEHRFRAVVDDNQLEIERGRATDPDAVIKTDPTTLAALAYEGADLTDALDRGALTIEGDRGAVERFIKLFSLPTPVPAPPPLVR